MTIAVRLIGVLAVLLAALCPAPMVAQEKARQGSVLPVGADHAYRPQNPPSFRDIPESTIARMVYQQYIQAARWKGGREPLVDGLRLIESLAISGALDENQWEAGWREFIHDYVSDTSLMARAVSYSMQQCSLHAVHWMFFEQMRLFLLGHEPSSRAKARFQRGADIARLMQKSLAAENRWSEKDKKCLKYFVSGIKVLAISGE